MYSDCVVDMCSLIWHPPLQVAQMQIDLEALQPQLIVASQEVDDIMVIIERDSIEVCVTPLLIILWFDDFQFNLNVKSALIISFFKYLYVQVAKTEKIVKAEEVIANEQASVAKGIKDECDADLAEAIPILESALSALNTLTPSVSFI